MCVSEYLASCAFFVCLCVIAVGHVCSNIDMNMSVQKDMGQCTLSMECEAGDPIPRIVLVLVV